MLKFLNIVVASHNELCTQVNFKCSLTETAATDHHGMPLFLLSLATHMSVPQPSTAKVNWHDGLCDY